MSDVDNLKGMKRHQCERRSAQRRHAKANSKCEKNCEEATRFMMMPRACRLQRPPPSTKFYDNKMPSVTSLGGSLAHTG